MAVVFGVLSCNYPINSAFRWQCLLVVGTCSVSRLVLHFGCFFAMYFVMLCWCLVSQIEIMF